MGMGKGIFNQLMFWVGPIDQFGQIDLGAVQKIISLTWRGGGGSSGDVRKKFSLLIYEFLILNITKNGIACSQM